MFESATTAPFALHIPGVDHDFKVLAFDGVEAISALYAIRVELVSEQPQVDLQRLLNQPAFLRFGLDGAGLHGHVEDVSAGEPGVRLTRYQLHLVPTLHYLQFSHDQRIFQHLTVPQIIAQVLKGRGIQADAYAFHVQTSAEREYCTQYGESDFAFIQRLCAEDGIAWHFQHSPQGHVLVFSDDQTWFPKLGATPYRHGAGLVAEHPVVSEFSTRLRSRTSATRRRHYDFQRPSLLLEGRLDAEFRPALEDYRYPAPIQSQKHGKQLARHALERHRVDYQVVQGASDQPGLRSGHFFDLTEHPRQAYNDLWLLHNVRHEGKQPQVLEEAITDTVDPADGFTQGYRNTFTATLWDVFYRPPLPPRKPLLVSQTARVTGPVGDDIYCDEYGRVKVEFHWDRAEHNSEKSSCWLRVASSWAGPGFGAVTVPRIGMEVVVTFLEGDPDQPLITGCVPNTLTAVPWPLPAHNTKTVLRSRSSPPTGGYNELSIEDRAGQERVYLRAQRDLEQLILNDSHSSIGNDRREQIHRDSHRLIGNDRFDQVDRHSASLIKGDELHTTQGQRHSVIGGDELIAISGNSSTTAEGTLVIQAGAHAHVTAANVVVSAGMSLTLQAGGQHIVINAAGIFSSVAIVQGGVAVAGIAAQSVRSLIPIAPEPLIAPSLAAQKRALTQAGEQAAPICAVCLKLAEGAA